VHAQLEACTLADAVGRTTGKRMDRHLREVHVPRSRIWGLTGGCHARCAKNRPDENYNPDTGEPVADTNFLSGNLLAQHWIEEIRSKRDPIAIPPR
jgi:hypothetical protein